MPFPNSVKFITLRVQGRAPGKGQRMTHRMTGRKNDRPAEESVGTRSTEGAKASLRGLPMNLGALGGNAVISGDFDVARIREKSRRRRLWHVFVWLLPVAFFVYWRVFTDDPLKPSLPHLMFSEWLMVVFIVVISLGTVMMFVGGGKSP